MLEKVGLFSVGFELDDEICLFDFSFIDCSLYWIKVYWKESIWGKCVMVCYM